MTSRYGRYALVASAAVILGVTTLSLLWRPVQKRICANTSTSKSTNSTGNGRNDRRNGGDGGGGADISLRSRTRTEPKSSVRPVCAVPPRAPELIDAVLTTEIDEVLRVLDDADADVNATDGEGNTALHVVAKLGHRTYPPAGIPRLLLDRGADVHARNDDGKHVYVSHCHSI
jgi:hypothetical protein